MEIKRVAKHLYNNRNINLKLLKSFKNLKNFKSKKIDLIILKLENNYLTILRVYFHLFLKRISFKKNIFLVFETKKIFYGQNILPCWSIILNKKKKIQNLLICLKMILREIKLLNKIRYVLIEIK